MDVVTISWRPHFPHTVSYYESIPKSSWDQFKRELLAEDEDAKTEDGKDVSDEDDVIMLKDDDDDDDDDIEFSVSFRISFSGKA